MAIRIAPYAEEHVGAVRDFNRRLAAGGATDQEFPESPNPGWMPDMHLYVAADETAVRGGYILRSQQFLAAGKLIDAAHYRLPLSEGVVDRAHAMLGIRLVRDALQRQPRLYAMGMGGWDKPLPKMLKSLKWRMCEVPFHFKVVHPAAFLRNIRPLRTTALRRFVMDAAATTGAAWAGMKLLGFARRVGNAPYELAPSFGGWADDIWARSHASYALTGLRDAATLDAFYPASDARFLRVRTPEGWAVALDTQMRDHKQFGDMRVGTIVDCFAPPEFTLNVMRAATSLLEQRGVDLIVSNQMHRAWSRALLDAGFRLGPSNYLLALSPEFVSAVGAAKEGEFHFTRGDGDGPIHL